MVTGSDAQFGSERDSGRNQFAEHVLPILPLLVLSRLPAFAGVSSSSI
jgi:hypothetical protein